MWAAAAQAPGPGRRYWLMTVLLLLLMWDP